MTSSQTQDATGREASGHPGHVPLAVLAGRSSLRSGLLARVVPASGEGNGPERVAVAAFQSCV
jgi:hypothetical protein